MSNYYPPVSFYFSVKFSGVSSTNDSSFAEASGLDAERGIVEIAEGGENRFSHRVPDRAKYGNLVLKRGLMASSSDLFNWCKEALESDLGQLLKPKEIDVSLLDPEGDPLLTWNFTRAWPVKWTVAGFDAKENAVALETLELAYACFTRKQNEDMGLAGLFEQA
jgi:phage tail-like protein